MNNSTSSTRGSPVPPSATTMERCIEIYHILNGNPYVDQDRLHEWLLAELNLSCLKRGYKGDQTLDQILGLEEGAD